MPDRARAYFERQIAPEAVVVWPEHRRALEVFQRCATLWRPHPMAGGVLGLDYPGVEVIMNAMRIRAAQRLDLLDELRIMERAAMAILNTERG